jgi:hypothetical protein
MNPDLPLLRTPPQYPTRGEAGQYRWGAANLAGIGVRAVPQPSHQMPGCRGEGPQPNDTNWDRTYDAGPAAEAAHVNVLTEPAALNRHLSESSLCRSDPETPAHQWKLPTCLPVHRSRRSFYYRPTTPCRWLL